MGSAVLVLNFLFFEKTARDCAYFINREEFLHAGGSHINFTKGTIPGRLLAPARIQVATSLLIVATTECTGCPRCLKTLELLCSFHISQMIKSVKLFIALGGASKDIVAVVHHSVAVSLWGQLCGRKSSIAIQLATCCHSLLVNRNVATIW